MEHKGTVLIETERLTLRRFVREDARPAFANWTNDGRVTEFLRWQPHGDIAVTERVVGEWTENYRDEKFYHWAIVPKDLGEPVGTITAIGVDDEAEAVRMGYCIGSGWWNKGYMSEALSAVVSFFFREVKAKRVEARHHPENAASGRVMEKCGLAFERVLKGADRSNKGIVDACVHALSAESYFASREAERRP